MPETSSPACLATAATRSAGATRMGSISPRRFASIAPRNDTSSHGWATATLIVASFCAAAIRRSYLSCEAPGGLAGSDIGHPPTPDRRKLGADQTFDPLETLLASSVQGAGRADEFDECGRRRRLSGLVARKQFRQGV